jgi:hypothetical protein
MAILGTLLKNGIRLRESLEQESKSPFELQLKELHKLLIKAERTDFGRKNRFKDILNLYKGNNEAVHKVFSQNIPIHDYNKIFDNWWFRLKNGEPNVTWPGKIRYFALSSGTSGSPSKYIPISKEMVKAIRRTGVRQILSLSKYNLPDSLYTKGILMLGGSTDLEFNGTYFSGDLSGITASRLPVWFQKFYKPGKKISKNKDWGQKIDQIVSNAKKWDIGIIVGVPAWLQILLEKIIHHYKLNNIHEIWPNLQIFVHGGVSFDPYKKGFEKLLGKSLIYMETYLASEGFIAFQARPNRKSMRLVLNNGIFYEFIPFTSENFDDNGNLKDAVKTLAIHQIEENKEYAVLISTCAGAWRYLIGDVIKFVSKEESEIVITGRTKHFLSLCGEHLSVDNMNKAIEVVSNKMNCEIREFTVIGEPNGSLFAHHWFIGIKDQIDSSVFLSLLDETLCEVNDDYAVERKHALTDIKLTVLKPEVFIGYLKSQGKEGGQSKFPRVLKGNALESWFEYLKNMN